MSAISVINIAVLLCAVGIVAGATQRCNSQKECPDYQCCSKKMFSPLSFCVNRRKKDDICMHDAVGHTLYNGLYDITCPCEGNLKCIKEEYLGEDGRIHSMGNARCREPTFPGNYPGANNAVNGNSVSANSNSEAEAY